MTKEEEETMAAIAGNEIPAPKAPEKPKLSAEDESKKEEIIERIEKSLNRIRPYIQSDGGDVQLVDFDYETGEVTVTMIGACAGCMLATADISEGVEAILMDEVPEVKNVRLCQVGTPWNLE